MIWRYRRSLLSLRLFEAEQLESGYDDEPEEDEIDPNYDHEKEYQRMVAEFEAEREAERQAGTGG